MKHFGEFQEYHLTCAYPDNKTLVLPMVGPATFISL